MSKKKKKKHRRVYFKKNKENPIHETDALAELVMLPALILLVSELPDSLSTDTITPTGALSHEWKNIKNRLQLVALKVRNNLDQGLAPGGMDHLYSPTPL